MRKRFFIVVALAILFCLVAARGAGIVNGTLDTTTECVGSLHELYSLGFLCSGTLIHESWVLTSAQCALVGPNVWAMGADWLDQPRAYWVDYVVVHPSFSGPGIADIALAHLAEPIPLEPVCSPLSPPEDSLTVGVQVNHVGFGMTGFPAGYTSQRHRTWSTISFLDPLSVWFDAAIGGTCYGDEGGPGLTAGGRVATVISGFADACDGAFVDSRVSTVYESFILATILDPPGLFFDAFESGDTSAWSVVAGG